MDPDAVLERMRALVEQIVDNMPGGEVPTELEDAAMELADKVEALDEWLVKGGVLPEPWRRHWRYDGDM